MSISRAAQQRCLHRLLTLQSSSPHSTSNRRTFSTTPSPPDAVTKTTTTPHKAPSAASSHRPPIDPRWLSTIKARIGKCLMFGLKPAQVDDAAEILRQIARDWRELVAGGEGFLTGYYGHVNNVNYVRYAETGRVNWTYNFGLYIDPAHKKEWMSLVGSTGIGLILKSMKVDYKFPMTWPDKITVYHKLTHAPPSDSKTPYSTWDLSVLILSEVHQRPAARCHEVITTYDYRLGRKTASIPPFMLKQFQSTWRLQEEAKITWQGRIEDINEKVRALETGSWDRPDAVEDMGSAG